MASKMGKDGVGVTVGGPEYRESLFVRVETHIQEHLQEPVLG